MNAEESLAMRLRELKLPSFVSHHASLAGEATQTSQGATISVVQQSEPGGDLGGALAMFEDTVYLQYIDPPGDIDLYTFDVEDDGARLSLSVSGSVGSQSCSTVHQPSKPLSRRI